MSIISPSDKEILRELAHRKISLAICQKNDEILKMWNKQSKGERDTPTVRLLFSNFTDEVIDSRMRCEGKEARAIERSLLSAMVGRELFDDDTPISKTFDIPLICYAYPFSKKPVATMSSNAKGYHIEPLTDDIEADIDMFKGGSFSVDRTGTMNRAELCDSIFGDILPSRIIGCSLNPSITNPLVRMIGMESYYLAMYDSPDALHEIMEEATLFYERYFDFLEANSLLLPTNSTCPVAQESFAFTDELPTDGNIDSAKLVWGFLESQETTAVSPAMYGEFVYPYYDRLVKRFGLLSYGCCERVDNIWEKYLSKWKNLRKLSVSPFNDERKIGEYLRGTRVVYYSKPRAEYVTNKGPLDRDALMRYFKGVAEAASGCLFEVAQREVGTIFGDFNRGKEYVSIAKEAIARYWKP